MKRSRFSEEQIIGILKEHEAGVSVADLCRQHGPCSRCPRMLAGRLQRRSTTLATWMEDAFRVRLHLPPAPGSGAALCQGLRASSRRSNRPTGHSNRQERTHRWIKLGGNVTRIPFQDLKALEFRRWRRWPGAAPSSLQMRQVLLRWEGTQLLMWITATAGGTQSLAWQVTKIFVRRWQRRGERERCYFPGSAAHSFTLTNPAFAWVDEREAIGSFVFIEDDLPEVLRNQHYEHCVLELSTHWRKKCLRRLQQRRCRCPQRQVPVPAPRRHGRSCAPHCCPAKVRKGVSKCRRAGCGPGSRPTAARVHGRWAR
jgi:hypothetical protein